MQKDLFEASERKKRMKHHLLLITFIICVACLFHLSVPLMTEAQTADIQQATRDAEKDVKILKELKWSGVGCLGGILPFAFLGVAVLTNQPEASAYDLLRIYGEYDTYFHAAFGVIFIAPTAYAIFRSPPPLPTNRFLGKSSDYIDAYTKAYERKSKRVRMFFSTMGVASGICIGWHTLIPFANSWLGGSPE